MATAMVGGAFLSAFLQVLFDRIASREVVDYVRGNKSFDGLLNKLKITLLSVNAVLDDAELKQIRNPTVKEWLNELKDAVYDADDLLDELAISGFWSESEHGSRNSTKVSDLFPFTAKKKGIFLCDQDIETKMEEILERLEYFVKQKDVLGLKEGVREKPFRRLPTTSLIEGSDVYGRVEDKDAIIKVLLEDENVGSYDKICVIPIVGMGGIGKTTLAQLVYNDEKVEEHFEVKAWVCVSEEFDVCRVTKTMVEGVTSVSCDVMDLNLLQVRLKARLMEKKFLIVLDDVWNENYVDWEVMSRPFQYGAQGSKIIVTTRSGKVASIMGTLPTYPIKELSDRASWLLFTKHAFACRDFTAHPVLETIGRKIVKNCGGLPLAVKTLGGLLRSTLDVGEWERILKSDIWDFTDHESNILPALRLSYYCLPSHLKRCFAYCSILPKDYEFEKESLVLLWMAENLLQQPNRSKRMEEVGDEYFDDLVSRSFFQKSRTKESHFVMHDLMNDLAKFVAGEYCFQLGLYNSEEIVMRARHLAYVMTIQDTHKRFNSVFEATRLRTFLSLNKYPLLSWANLSNNIVHDLLLKLRCLRVLSLSGYRNVNQLPDLIGELTHLRYMDLSYTSISWLPESTSMLYNLQTLNLSNCRRLTRLPKDIHRLINLRYLDVSRSYQLKIMPAQISKLRSLQRLSTFIVGKDKRSGIEELKELSNLRGTLCIKNLQNVVNAKDASEAKLVEKKNLKGLCLEWDDHTNDTENERDVLENLLPFTTLEMLTINQYGGTRFPNWFGDHSFCNIVVLTLANCKYCYSLPPLGQLHSLKTLYIMGLEAIVTVGPEFYGKSTCSILKPFASLEILHFSSMSSWQEWLSMEVEVVGAFPKLRQLNISCCPNLVGTLPCFFPSLTRMIINECQHFRFSLPKMPIVRELTFIDYENLLSQEFPPTVDSLRIERCHGQLGSLFKASMQVEMCLQYLYISDCSSSISIGCLPTALRTLEINNCDKLEFPFPHSHKFLERICIKNSCDFLISFPLNSFPKLNMLSIHGCRTLESLYVLDGLCQDLTSLSYLYILDCPNFASFPKGGLSATNLTKLKIGQCDKLKFLPEKMHTLFPSLQYLDISDCPDVELFPEASFPLSLQKLDIANCNKLIASRMSWNLRRLSVLENFSIGAESADLKSFPEEGLLPTAITSLTISGISCLKILDMRGTQELTSLKELVICNCVNLQTMPEGLPNSLELLNIHGCPLLEEKCQRETGEYWNKIARIPSIRINGDII